MNPTETPTPRTDSEAIGSCGIHSPEMVRSVFARQLERELATKNELLFHAYLHDGYRDCGFMKMTTPQKKLFVTMLREHDMPESADHLDQFISKEAE